MLYKRENITIEPLPDAHTFKDLTGHPIRWFSVIGYAGKQGRHPMWWCECRCGNIKRVRGTHMVKGKTHSCGCLAKRNVIARATILTKTNQSFSQKLKTTWQSMRQRCNVNIKNVQMEYVGRGITICDRWLYSFDNFITDMGEPPSKHHSIERRDNDGNYCPENCYWGTGVDQANNKRNNKWLEFQGRTQTLAQWCRELDLSYHIVKARLYAKWSIEKAFLTGTNKRFSPL